MLDVTEVINKFGFPIVMAVGMGYFIYYIWKFVTTEIKVKLSEANTVLIGFNQSFIQCGETPSGNFVLIAFHENFYFFNGNAPAAHKK